MTETTETVRGDRSERKIDDDKQYEDKRGKSILSNVYGNLYEDSAGTDITLTDADTFYQWVSSTVGLTSGVGYVVGDAGDDDLTIGVSGGGVYMVLISASFSGSNNSAIHGAVFLNGSEVDSIQFHRKLGGADLGSASANGLLSLSSGDIVDLRFASDTGPTTVTVEHVQLTIVRISA